MFGFIPLNHSILVLIYKSPLSNVRSGSASRPPCPSHGDFSRMHEKAHHQRFPQQQSQQQPVPWCSAPDTSFGPKRFASTRPSSQHRDDGGFPAVRNSEPQQYDYDHFGRPTMPPQYPSHPHYYPPPGESLYRQQQPAQAASLSHSLDPWAHGGCPPPTGIPPPSGKASGSSSGKMRRKHAAKPSSGASAMPPPAEQSHYGFPPHFHPPPGSHHSSGIPYVSSAASLNNAQVAQHRQQQFTL